ncbi:MAG: BREX system P-loop protein BrxC, partial [Desulfobacterales bacterium]|nr:BREX system P-loop protein BrxC [Desulfobacterales bacterium]
RDLARSRHVVNRFAAHVQSLSRERRRLFREEESRCEDLEKHALSAVAGAFMDGAIYFRGRAIDKAAHGVAFLAVLRGATQSILPELYSRFIDIAVTPGELNQLLEPALSGPSHKFMAGGLGVLDLDAGKYIPVCDGAVPARVFQRIQDQDGVSGTALFSHFGGPPHGHPPDVIKACLAGLLRAGKIRIRPDMGAEITSIRDPGARDMFQKDREIKRSDILPPNDKGISGRDRVAICKFFKRYLNEDPDRENDAIADAVFIQFPHQVKQLQEVEKKFNRLPGRPDLPDALEKLRKALEDCKRSRHIEPTVKAVKKNLDVLMDGVQQLGILSSELTPSNLDAVRRASNARERQAAQLADADALGDLAENARKIDDQLKQERPWREIAGVQPDVALIEERYREERLALIERQERSAREIRERVKQRTGFEKLDDDQSHHVLRPITLKLYDTTPADLHPTLALLRDTVKARLREAEKEANARLDDILSDVEGEEVRPVAIRLAGLEVATPEEVEDLVNELRDRLLAQLKENTRIRLV